MLGLVALAVVAVLTNERALNLDTNFTFSARWTFPRHVHSVTIASPIHCSDASLWLLEEYANAQEFTKEATLAMQHVPSIDVLCRPQSDEVCTVHTNLTVQCVLSCPTHCATPTRSLACRSHALYPHIRYCQATNPTPTFGDYLVISAVFVVEFSVIFLALLRYRRK